MDNNGDEVLVSPSPIDMNGEESMAQSKSDNVKPTYKSFKKKYRKMRIKFDEKMRQSNDWYMEEQTALDTARRLAQENDRLLDLLLDVNNSAQIPADKRIDLTLDTPSLAAVPALVSADELSKVAECNSSAGQAMYNEIRTILGEKTSTRAASKTGKSLAALLQTTPHLSLNSANISPDLITSLEAPEGHPAPITYLTLDQLDDYLYEIDASLGTAIAPPYTQSSTQQDLALRNPHSVYNWLRRHEPKIFLQDGEGSEKSLGKPGALRGAGKRASIPAPSKPDSLEFVEEDGLGYDVTLSGSVGIKGKRKREKEEDDGYTPKSGKTEEVRKKRAYRKRGEASAESTGSAAKKGKGKARMSSPHGPEPHPFGPM